MERKSVSQCRKARRKASSQVTATANRRLWPRRSRMASLSPFLTTPALQCFRGFRERVKHARRPFILVKCDKCSPTLRTHSLGVGHYC